ncbi:SDR family NAD(P)-dependent oxidoreductase [Candidatus Desantisbacteria bacterium]|nr:SDR family NAD(P)-dependent oxidoreductase [Candidatus Desantisbacteria bacterium]
MKKNILVTGGAGFIGSHIVDELVKRGHNVTVYDNLEPQVHGINAKIPDYLNKEIKFIKADVRDRNTLKKAIKNIDTIFHKAAMVGVGQSMYKIEHYVSVNTLGGATLLDILANEKHSVSKLIVASSMSIYGEGEYNCAKCGRLAPELRSMPQLLEHNWELKCPECGEEISPIPTSENKKVIPNSIYSITKRDHEEMFLVVGRAYDIPTVAFRYFNVYGSRQALSNPYTGVAAIFSGRLLNNNMPVIYEDGLQTRDFIHVSDVVQANMLAMENEKADYSVFNVGTGRKLSVLDVAKIIAKNMGKDISPNVIGKFRKGDVRHCYSDNSKINKTLGFIPEVTFEKGMKELISWVAIQNADDKGDKAVKELELYGLTV